MRWKTRTAVGVIIGRALSCFYYRKRSNHALTKALFPESEVTVIRRLPSTLFPKDERNVQKLTKVYEQITGLDGTPVTTTGATYARFMPNIVAFGPSFPGQKALRITKMNIWMKRFTA